MQFGTPITIMSGGISAIMIVMLKLSAPIVPIDHTTAIATTRLQINTTRKDRKKKYIRSEVIKSSSAMKIYISLSTRLPITTRIWGIPAYRGLPKYCSYDDANFSTSNTTFAFFWSVMKFSST